MDPGICDWLLRKLGKSGRDGTLTRREPLLVPCVHGVGESREQTIQSAGVDTFSILRLGVVLAPDAPAWKKMLLPFKIGAGGPLGSGEQWFSWVMLEDVVKMVNHLLENPSSAAGIWNGTAPGAVQQKDLATAIGKAYNRPALLPTPAWVLRLALGDMADELVLASCKAVPGAFQSERFQYFYPDLDAALSRLSSSE